MMMIMNYNDANYIISGNFCEQHYLKKIKLFILTDIFVPFTKMWLQHLAFHLKTPGQKLMIFVL